MRSVADPLGRSVASDARESPSRPERATLVVAFVVVAIACVVGPVVAFREGYVAFADDSMIASYVHDVLSAHTPLLGMPSSTSTFGGAPTNHPGPLLFWFYLPWVWLFGSSTGLLVGAALLNVLACLGCQWAAWRRGGTWVGLLGLGAAAAALVVIGGPGGAFRPVNSLVVSLPFVLFLILSWGVAVGDRALIPLWLLVGSFVVQADLLFVVQVGGVGAVAAISCGIAPGPRPAAPRHEPSRLLAVLSWALLAALGLLLLALLGAVTSPFMVVAALLLVGQLITMARSTTTGRGASEVVTGSVGRRSLAVILFAWGAPLIEAAQHGGGNVRNMVRYLGEEIPGQGWRAASATVGIAVRPPTHVIDAASWIGPGLVVTAVILLGLVGLAVRGGGQQRRLLGLAVTAIATSGLAASQVPAQVGFSLMHLLWIPLIACFVWFAILVCLGAALPDRPRVPAIRTGATTVLVLVVVGWSLRMPSTWGLSDREVWAHEAVASLGDQVRPVTADDGRYALVATGGSLPNAVLGGVRDQMEARGATVLLGASNSLYGPHLFTPSDPSLDGVLTLAPADATPPAGATVVASSRPSGWDERKVASLADSIGRFARDAGPLVLTPEGKGKTDRLLAGRARGGCLVELSKPGACRVPSAEALLQPGAERGLLDAYASGWVASPQLPPALAREVGVRYDELAFVMWLSPARGSG